MQTASKATMIRVELDLQHETLQGLKKIEDDAVGPFEVTDHEVVFSFDEMKGGIDVGAVVLLATPEWDYTVLCTVNDTDRAFKLS